MSESLLEVEDLHKDFVVSGFGRRSQTVQALAGVSFTIAAGETLGVVGESGCGKSTLARTLLWLDPPTSGVVRFDGRLIDKAGARELRRRAQMVFQDPYTSLPPRMRVKRIIGDALITYGLGRNEIPDRVRDLLSDVGLKPDVAGQLPHQLSGGQRQRVGIARALSLEPVLVVADEAVSSLDASVKAQILNLLRDLQDQRGLTYLFISHDLSVVRFMSHRIAVMYLGQIVELGPAEDICRRPIHPYSVALLSAVPSLAAHATRVRLLGEPPRPTNPPKGCRFHPRCPLAQERCAHEAPQLREVETGRYSACHFAESVTTILGKES